MATTPIDSSGHESTARLLLAVVIVELVLGTIVMILRTYTKFRLTKEAGNWSFFWAILTWVAGIINFAAVTLSVSHGLGRRSHALLPPDIVNSTKWSYISDGTSRLGVTCGRLAITAFVYGIQGKTAAPWRKMFLWVVGTSNVVLNVVVVFLLFFRCQPAAYGWDKGISGGSCPLENANRYTAYFVLSWGAASDLILACYPITVVSRLNMPTRTKVTLSVIMSMGILACVCAIMTVYELVRVTIQARDDHAGPAPTDPTFLLTPVTIWAVTEMWVVLIAPSVPPLWPLFKKLSCRPHHRSLPSQKTFAPTHSDASQSSSGAKASSHMHITVISDIEVSTIDRPAGSVHEDEGSPHTSEKSKQWNNSTSV